MGCAGCLPTEKERQQMMDAKYKEAHKHAVNAQKLYVLYDLPDGGVNFMEAEAARASGIRPTRFVSYFEPATNG